MKYSNFDFQNVLLKSNFQKNLDPLQIKNCREFEESDSFFSSEASENFQNLIPQKSYLNLQSIKSLNSNLGSNSKEKPSPSINKSTKSYSVFEDSQILLTKQPMKSNPKKAAFKNLDKVAKFLDRSLFAVQNRSRFLTKFSPEDLDEIVLWYFNSDEESRNFIITYDKIKDDNSQFEYFLTGFVRFEPKDDRKLAFKERSKRTLASRLISEIKMKLGKEIENSTNVSLNQTSQKEESLFSEKKQNKTCSEKEKFEWEIDTLSFCSLFFKQDAEEKTFNGSSLFEFIEEEGFSIRKEII